MTRKNSRENGGGEMENGIGLDGRSRKRRRGSVETLDARPKSVI